MKIIFFGTPYYVIPILEALHKSFKDKTGSSPIEAVVTQPPKPAGRNQKLEYSAVDSWAFKKDIKILRDLDIKEFPKADVGVLASYGNIVPKEIVNHFPLGIVVVHPSLLPKFRWASPVPAALVTGTNPTGITIIKMDEKWDHGPIITQAKINVEDDDTYGSLRDRLFAMSGEMLVQMLPAYIQGKIKLKAQDDSKASYARMIKKEDAFIPPEYLNAALQGESFKGTRDDIPFIKNAKGKLLTIKHQPLAINNFIRAMDPWPVAWTEVKLEGNKVAKRLRILRAHLEDSKLVLDEVQLEGKNPVTWEQFKQGYPDIKFA